MRAEDLFEAVGGIDDKLIARGRDVDGSRCFPVSYGQGPVGDP